MTATAFLKNPALGYYRVGEKVFTSKVSALVDSTERNIQAEWIFNNDVFDLVDWTVEPNETLQELYKQRALELREKYDYLILMYSGGSDSQNILNAFLNNGIKLDEVISVWANDTLSKTYTPNSGDYSWDNFLSEWDFTVKPKLKWLESNHPEIKITIHDWAQDATRVKIADDYIMDRNHNFTPFASSKWNYYQIPSIKSKLDKNENVCVVLGTDKPRVCIHENAYRLYFLDIVTANTGPHFSSNLLQDKLHLEFFYWSPSSCKILAKQSHLLVNFFESMPRFKQYIEWPVTDPAHRQFYETVTRAIIYPDVNLRFFQVEKPKDMNIGMDVVLFKIGYENRIKGMTNDNFSYLQKVIAPRYFTQAKPGEIPSLTGFITGMWPIKNSSLLG